MTGANEKYTTKRYINVHIAFMIQKSLCELFDIQVLMMVAEIETLTSTLHHNIFTYLDYVFFCYLHTVGFYPDLLIQLDYNIIVWPILTISRKISKSRNLLSLIHLICLKIVLLPNNQLLSSFDILPGVGSQTSFSNRRRVKFLVWCFRCLAKGNVD